MQRPYNTQATNAGAHTCIIPCTKFFATSGQLSRHRTQSAACAQRWTTYLANLHAFHEQQPLPDIPGVWVDEEPDGSVFEASDVEDLEPPPPVDNFDEGVTIEPIASALHAGNEGQGVAPLLQQEEEIQSKNLDVDEEEDIFDEHPDAGHIYERIPPPFQNIAKDHVDLGQGNLYYPFSCREEWEVARWLHESGLTQRQIDKFFHLEYVSNFPYS